MKKEMKKLSLNKETISTLNIKQMSKVLGGVTIFTVNLQANTLETTAQQGIGGERTKTSQ